MVEVHDIGNKGHEESDFWITTCGCHGCIETCECGQIQDGPSYTFEEVKYHAAYTTQGFESITTMFSWEKGCEKACKAKGFTQWCKLTPPQTHAGLVITPKRNTCKSTVESEGEMCK